jgi:tetratricopeptide (TPR) repeat protein
MKKILLFLMLCVHCISPVAQKNVPKWMEKAKKAVFTIETYDANGNTRKGNGFFIQKTGEAVSDYTLFTGAEKAIVTDAEGRKMPVTQILGADELYDVIRFMVAIPEKSVPFLPLAGEMPVVGSEVCMLPYGLEKGTVPGKGAILEITNIKDQYGYYKIDIPLEPSRISTPLLTPDGEVFAMAQADASGKNQTYGISVPYIRQIHITPMDVWNQTYSSVNIRKAWANTPEDAQVALMLYASRQDAPTYLETLNDFIATFPESPEGYLGRASHYAYYRKALASSEAAQQQMLSLAQADMNTAMKYQKKGEGYYSQAKLIYGVAVSDSTAQSGDWNVELALEKVRNAIAEEDLPAYRQLEGDIAYYTGNYENAYISYMLVNQSPLSSATSYYLAAKAKQQIAGTSLIDVIALIDSAAIKSASVPSDALAYLQENAELKMQLGLYDAAIKDYDQCYSLMAGNVTDAFYYYRAQAKFRSGNLEGALKDIGSAIALDPENAIYHAEKASVYLRMQDPLKAQECVEKALALDPDFASGHRLLGVCCIRRQKKEDACKAFSKAKELGDPIVDKLIKENCSE